MKAKIIDKVATFIIIFFSGCIILVLLGLLGFVFFQGARHVDWHFITSSPQLIKGGGGIGPQLFNSVFLVVLTLLITIPIGWGAGIYMAQYAKNRRATTCIRLAVEVLSSFPSIVVGLFGLLLFVHTFHMKFSLLSGALTLAIFNLPIIVRTTEQAFRALPKEQKEAGLALGCSKWKIIVSILFPIALPSLITGTILACGRIFGEAAALMFTAGMSSPPLDFTDWNPLHTKSPIYPLRPAETLAVHIWKVNSEQTAPDTQAIVAGASAVLVFMVLLFNTTARWMGRVVYRKMTATK